MNYIGIEERLTDLFSGLFRKDGKTHMVSHSIDVGRILARANADPSVIFAGYYHDVPEDIDSITSLSLSARKEFVRNEAHDVFGLRGTSLDDAARITMACIYLPEEYEAEQRLGGKAGKALRKQMACQRWANGEKGVLQVKSADITSNRKTARDVSLEFEEAYNAWATPLLDTMQARLKSMELIEPSTIMALR